MKRPLHQSKKHVQATCSCGSGIPIQKVMINGQAVTLIALPVILQQFKEAGKVPGTETITELLDLLNDVRSRSSR